MATSSSGRQSRRSVNTLGQEELRRLMRAKQRESAAGKRKIDSPYVRYNSLGNLSCCLCNVTVKNELLWQTHVLGKQHKENIKYSTSKSFTETSSPLKKKKLEPRILDQKKGQDCNDHQPQAVSSNLPKTFFDKIEQTEVEIISSKSSSVVLLGNYKTEEGKKEDMTKEIRERDSKTSLPTPAQYELSSDLVPKAELVACSSTVNVKKQEKVKPANKAQPTSTVDLLECLHKWASTPGQNYLENNALATPQLSHSESVQKAEPQEKNHQRRENTAEALPEGFFDDPEVDAKVRKVDTPKDQMDKEWDEFQKAMRQINTISEAIVAEEDEEGRLDRQIGEIDEQIECFRRVEQLRDRQEIRKDQLKEAMSQTVTQTKEDDDIDSNDEDELQDLLSQDWRAKGTIL